MTKPWYNGEHPKVRAEVAKGVTADTTCVLCGLLRCPRSGALLALAWDLAHDDQRPGVWLGPAHPYCNRSKGRESPRSAHGRATRSLPITIVARGLGRARRVRESPGQSVDGSSTSSMRLRETPGQRLVFSRNNTLATPESSLTLSSGAMVSEDPSLEQMGEL